MVVILRPDRYEQWLDPKERPAEEMLALLEPYPASEMEAVAVSKTVNNPRNETPDCLAPAAAETLF
jgi:putative SOS response-associated peptidase YedK